MRRRPIAAQRGVSLIEVLVTMIILAVGLLGLVGLQARLQILQMEAYQRAQALILLRDMAGRIATNRNDAVDYVTAGALGGTTACPTDVSDRQKADVVEWCNALKGAAEVMGGSGVGAMVGGRGCVESIDAPNGLFMVTVAWQGLAPISAPPASVTCGLNLYDGGAGSVCTGDLCRRVVNTVVVVPPLT